MNLLTIGGSGNLVWPDMPAAKTEFQGLSQHRTKVDLAQLLSAYHATQATGTDNAGVQLSKDEWNARHTSKAVSARLVANVVITPGAAGSLLRAEYSLDGSSWSYLDGAHGPEVDISATGLSVGSWVTIDTAALAAEVYLRLVGILGDAAADPEFGLIQLQVK